MPSLSLTQPPGKFLLSSDFYTLGLASAAAGHCGALDFIVKQGENANKVIDPDDARRRPFTLLFEESPDYAFTPQHTFSVAEDGPARCILASFGGAFAGVNNQRDTFATFTCDEQLVAWPDRFLIRYVWRNTSATPAVVWSNLHCWWYTNGFYSQATMVKQSARRAAYDGGTFDCGVCVWKWNDFAFFHTVTDNAEYGRITHWYRSALNPAPTSADGDFPQILAIFVQPPGSSTGDTDVLAKIDDYHKPDAPEVTVGARKTDTPGDDDADGFNESNGAYQFSCDLNRASFSLDVERRSTPAISFYYPAFILHGYTAPAAPLLRLNGSLLDGETGTPHPGPSHQGASYNSAVLSGNRALVWTNSVITADSTFDIAPSFGTRKLIRVGCSNIRA
ncbi:MAG TPA: hypothetical protein VM223_05185 [Planctomycetota bacterium]|nr:hypothetical protein [Planctomycetota bacterium]